MLSFPNKLLIGFWGMRVEFHSFHWDNYNQDMLEAHQRVMKHFNINVQYTCKNIPHGAWLNDIFRQSTADVIGIIEPDLIPLHRKVIDDAIEYVTFFDTFMGHAQTSNHIFPCSHVFASPAFFFMTKSCYLKLGQPSFLEIQNMADVAEHVSYRAEELGIRYKTLFPTCFDREPREGVWPLGSYGFYGVGTVFGDSIYHLFQGRFADNAQLFVKRCNEVIAGTFSTEGFHPSTNHFYTGNIVPPCSPPPKKWYHIFR